MEHVINFGNDGAVVAMHNDSFDLGFLGAQSIKRASEILWDEEAQKWSIHFADRDGTIDSLTNKEYKGFAEYRVAREFEVAVMNHAYLMGLPPRHPAIREWAASQR